MAKLHVCAIKDTAAQMFGQPFFSASKGSAVRNFGDAVNRQEGNNPLNMHPDDFELYYLGTFDDSEAKFECGPPEILARGKDLKVRG